MYEVKKKSLANTEFFERLQEREFHLEDNMLDSFFKSFAEAFSFDLTYKTISTERIYADKTYRPLNGITDVKYRGVIFNDINPAKRFQGILYTDDSFKLTTIDKLSKTGLEVDSKKLSQSMMGPEIIKKLENNPTEPVNSFKTKSCKSCHTVISVQIDLNTILDYFKCPNCKKAHCVAHGDNLMEKCFCFCPKCIGSTIEVFEPSRAKNCRKCNVSLCRECDRMFEGVNKKCECSKSSEANIMCSICFDKQ